MNKLEKINRLANSLMESDFSDYDIYTHVTYIYELSQPVKFNKNQQAVLEYLKNSSGNEGSLMLAIGAIVNLSHYTINEDSKYLKQIKKAFASLTREQEAEVLQAFAGEQESL